MYRMQKLGPATTAMHWQIHKDAAADWRGMGETMDVAVALGLDPITAYTASAPLPKHIDEFMLAGFLRGSPVEMVKARTVDLEVPAHAEIVIEGQIRRGELVDEGPFGDHTGYYTPVEPFPAFHVTAITMRRDAIYPSIIVGVPPQEDVWLGKVTERLFLPAVQMTMPEVVDYDLPFAGAFHNLAIVSIRKAFPGHAQKVMHAIWGTGLLSLTKGVVVVDEWVDVHDYTQVMWQVGANVDPERDVMLSPGPARPSRPRADAPVRGRQDRYRCHSQGAGGGLRSGLAGGHQDESRDLQQGDRAGSRVWHSRYEHTPPWCGVVWPRCTDWRTTWRIPPPVRKHTPTTAPQTPTSATTRGQFLTLSSVGLGAMIGGVIGVPATAYLLAPVTQETTFQPVLLGWCRRFTGETELRPDRGHLHRGSQEPCHQRRPRLGALHRQDRHQLARTPERDVRGVLQPLHAPRLPRRRDADGLCLPLPRRPVYDQQGHPHRRPADPPARPLPVGDQEGPQGDELWITQRWSVYFN